MSDNLKTDEDICFADLAPAIEFATWTVVLLAPLLRLVNGAAVTNDQWWIQVFLFTSALVGACALRTYQVLLRRKSVARQSRNQNLKKDDDKMIDGKMII